MSLLLPFLKECIQRILPKSANIRLLKVKPTTITIPLQLIKSPLPSSKTLFLYCNNVISYLIVSASSENSNSSSSDDGDRFKKTLAAAADLENFDKKFLNAYNCGEDALLEYLHSIQLAILETGKSYLTSLSDQINIIEAAKELGPLSSKWDDLPEIRLLGQELEEHLNNLIIIFKMIGLFIEHESLQVIGGGGSDNNLEFKSLMSDWYSETRFLLDKTLNEIKQTEKQLLQLKYKIEVSSSFVKVHNMSLQKGNTNRSRSQKYKNRTAFKNDLHDTSGRTKLINSIQVSDVCNHCKDVIEWKIKYKKYKPLSQPKTCVKCGEKRVKQAYHVMCVECGRKFGLCSKCCQAKELIVNNNEDHDDNTNNVVEQLKVDSDLKNLFESLPERKRRTFLRCMEKNKQVSKHDLILKFGNFESDHNDDDDGSSSTEQDY